MFNLGAVHKVSDAVSLFANFAQGFSTPHLGCLFRFLPTEFTLVENATDNVPIDSYLTLDYISSIQLRAGRLQIGIENLLDNQYFPVQSQIQSSFFEQLNYAARGRTIWLNYSVTC